MGDLSVSWFRKKKPFRDFFFRSKPVFPSARRATDDLLLYSSRERERTREIAVSVSVSREREREWSGESVSEPESGARWRRALRVVRKRHLSNTVFFVLQIHTVWRMLTILRIAWQID